MTPSYRPDSQSHLPSAERLPMSGLPPPGTVQLATTLRLAEAITARVAGALSCAAKAVGAAIGDIELRPVATRVEPMRADAGLDEIELPEGIAVDHHDAVADEVGDEEDLAIRRAPDV